MDTGSSVLIPEISTLLQQPYRLTDPNFLAAIAATLLAILDLP